MRFEYYSDDENDYCQGEPDVGGYYDDYDDEYKEYKETPEEAALREQEYKMRKKENIEFYYKEVLRHYKWAASQPRKDDFPDEITLRKFSRILWEEIIRIVNSTFDTMYSSCLENFNEVFEEIKNDDLILLIEENVSHLALVLNDNDIGIDENDDNEFRKFVNEKYLTEKDIETIKAMNIVESPLVKSAAKTC